MIYNLDILAIAAAATTLATQILKSKYIPIPAQKYPRITAAIVALGASLFAVYQTGYDITSSTSNLTQFVAFVFATLLIASATYNNLLRG